MNATKVKHHSPDEIRGYVHDAEAILREGGYDDAERIALLPTIIGLLAAASIQIAVPTPVQLPAMRIPGKLS